MEKITEEELQDFENYLIDELRFSPSTVKSTMKKMEYVSRHCDIEDRQALQGFIRSVWGTKKNKTADGYVKVINRWAKFKHLDHLPYFHVSPSFTIKYCTQEEKEQLLRSAAMIGSREKAIISVLFGCGLRLQEATDLKISSMDKDTVTVLGKGQKERVVYVPIETRKALQDYLQKRIPPDSYADRDYVFTTRAGRKMTYDYFRKICGDIGMAAGIKFHAHMARHTYATELLKAGVDIYYVSKQLGHSNVGTTQIYLHPTQDDALNAVRKAFESDMVHKAGELYGTGPKGTSRKNPRDNELDFEEEMGLLFYNEVEERAPLSWTPMEVAL